MNKIFNYIADLVATFFYIGYIPFCPGTAASLATVILFYFLPTINPFYFLLTLLFLFFIGIWSSKKIAISLNKKDPSEIVIDEVVGMGISLFLIPKNFWFYFIAFLLFRFFDITKVFPINKAEKLRDGWGIILDDVVAGVFSFAILKSYLLFFSFPI